MNILVICNSTVGLEVFRGMLLKELIQKHHLISAIVPVSYDNSEKAAETELENMGCKLIHIPIERRGMNPFKDISLFFQYLHVLKKQCPDYVMTYTIKPNVYGGMACRIMRVPYIANITGLGTAFQNDGILRRLTIAMYKIALKGANVVFFENVSNRDTIVKLGIIEQKKTHVLPGAGVELDRFMYTEYPKEDGETRFIFIGRVMREKGIDELFTAMQRLRKEHLNCSLDVLGGFEEDYAEQLELFEQNGWLHYYGFQTDIRPLVEKAHCLVLPSWHEGMSNANLECAAMGRPVITSDINGCKEAVVDGESGLLCKCRDVDSLYRIMKKFIELPYEEKKQMGKAGRHHMENVFDKKKVVAETLGVSFAKSKNAYGLFLEEER